HQAPVVHVRVLYHVGSRDERPDRNGFAHMFEHMMFRGSAHVAPEEHMKRIGVVGGRSNAFTSFDQTVYVNTIPSQYMDMALWLEADRMSSFKVSDEIYQTERKVVAEEWRMRQNQPYGNAYELFLANAFKTHSYRWTPIGNMDHLKAARVNELQDFFNTYYLPNNAVLVIAGDFKADEAKQFVHKYYGWIPKGATPPRNIPAEPDQTEPRQSSVSEAVPLPMIMIGYHIPDYASDDQYAIAALDTILGSGDSSRLQRLLVNSETPLCVSAGSMHLQTDDPGMFGVSGVVLNGKSVDEVRTKLEGAVADVVAKGVTDEERNKAKTILLTSIVNGRKTAEDLASQLGNEALFANDAGRVNAAPEKIKALTAEDVQGVAAKYLLPGNSNTLNINPSLTAALASKAEVKKAEELKNAPVEPATAPVETRVVEFPESYPTTAPTAQPAENPEFAKGTESEFNGVKVIVMPDARLPLVDWSLTMRRGSQSDPKGKEGAAWLTAEMLRRGVQGMDFQQLTGDLDGRAISITVGDGGDYTRLNGSSTTDQLDHAMTRSRQILRTPTFPEDEFAKLKEQSINALQVDQQSPTWAANIKLTTALFGDTPLGRYATPETVAALTLDDVKQSYATHYRPNDAIFLIAGDVTVERGRALAEALLKEWEAGPLPPVAFELPEVPAKRKILLVDRPDAKQASVRAGIRAYTLH
nr:insulinase family protein [Chthoniobacterales bacterium]